MSDEWPELRWAGAANASPSATWPVDVALLRRIADTEFDTDDMSRERSIAHVAADEIERLRALVAAFVSGEPIYDDDFGGRWCIYCNYGTADRDAHDADCPWVKANAEAGR